MAGHMGPLIEAHRTVGNRGRHASAEADFDPDRPFGQVLSCEREKLQSVGGRVVG